MLGEAWNRQFRYREMNVEMNVEQSSDKRTITISLFFSGARFNPLHDNVWWHEMQRKKKKNHAIMIPWYEYNALFIHHDLHTCTKREYTLFDEVTYFRQSRKHSVGW